MEKKLPVSTHSTSVPQAAFHFNSTSVDLSFSNDKAPEWHSTPKKKTQPQIPSSRKPSASNQILCNVTATTSHDSDRAISSTPLAGIRAPVLGGKYLQSSPSLSEDSVVNQQHRELQLLIAELKDQDKELNNMSEAHKKQLIGWEKDRQRILALEERSAKLEKELHKKKEIIQTLTQRLKITESQKQELLDKEQKANNQCQILQETNQSQNSTIIELSRQVGQLQMSEQELTGLLKSKDKDMIEATEHIVNMTTEIQRLDAMLNESRKRETDVKMEAQKYKQQMREVRHEMKSLKDVVEKTSENSRQREDIIRLKQENQLLRNELSLLGEREQRKNELLNLAKSKQDRTDSELQCLRQVCENQQNDLELLYLSLNSQAGLQKLEAWGRSLSDRSHDFKTHSLELPVKGRNTPQRGSIQQNDSFGSNVSLVNGDLNHKGDSQDELSSTQNSQIQRMIAESKQIVASLERHTSVPVSPAHSLSSRESESHLRDQSTASLLNLDALDIR
ncbi:coiled-coil domain-containing protein 62 isoform X2 [Erpetoichthys calabaricus]|uniref:coiled-coil domain-containing protein 62 isoform X2 n=1 Tax=Erpetoichthys calabaricus TaxID=27687 RepID=UPI002234D015|nr:coiled-coil domain-containing protein 62 isoform X2 [Erpetoichthys calabaricus]